MKTENENTEIYPIGEKGYPLDNSYAFTIGTNENPWLAGLLDQKLDPARKVTIVSKPYLIKNHWEEQSEVVTVMYNRKCHVVLNEFVKTFKETL